MARGVGFVKHFSTKVVDKIGIKVCLTIDDVDYRDQNFSYKAYFWHYDGIETVEDLENTMISFFLKLRKSKRRKCLVLEGDDGEYLIKVHRVEMCRDIKNVFDYMNYKLVSFIKRI